MNKIVSREVIGSANPFAKYFRELGNSIKGIGTGIIMIIVSFVMIWFFANQTEHSKIIAALPLQTPAEVMGMSEMVKIHAVPTYSNLLVAEETDKDVLFYTYQLEDFAVREVERTRTITENGQEIKETYIELVDEWRTKDTRTKWSDFELGGINIESDGAKLQMDMETFYTDITDMEYNKYLDREQLVNIVQKERVTVTGVNSTDELIVVGMLANDQISTGGEEGTFFISNKTNEKLVQDQASAEQMTFWILVAITWFLMATGFTMLFGPITKILNIIPGVGGLVSSLLFIIFGLISAFIIFIAYIGIKFWWAILLVIIFAVAYFIYSKAKKKEVVAPAAKA